MDIKIEIKEEGPLSEDKPSWNEKEFCTKIITMKTDNDAMLLHNDCDVIKTEIKIETRFSDICSQKERECFIRQIKSETVTSSNNCAIGMKTETEDQSLCSVFGSQNEKECLAEDPVMNVKEYCRDYEDDNRIDIKEETWWMEMETSSISDDIKDEDFPPVKSSRLCTEAVTCDSRGESPLSVADISGLRTIFFDLKYPFKCTNHKSGDRELPMVQEQDILEKHGKSSDGGELFNKAVCCEQTNLLNKLERQYKCNVCMKSFRYVSHLKRHEFIHRGERPHKCKTCFKSFTHLSNLKMHNLIHEGKKPYQCKTCNKNFTRLSSLKMHNLIHEGKKPYICKTCGKSFTRLSNLKIHNIIHQDMRSYQCKICRKRFSCLSDLNTHILTHGSMKPYQCTTCKKNFTRLSDLKRHNFIHEGRKPHECKTCEKRFTQVSDLKRHTLIHEGKKPYQCKICNRTFTRLSNLKKHNLTHKGKVSS